VKSSAAKKREKPQRLYRDARDDAKHYVNESADKAAGEIDTDLAELCILAQLAVHHAASLFHIATGNPWALSFIEEQTRLDQVMIEFTALLNTDRHDEFLKRWPMMPGTAFAWFGDCTSTLDAAHRFGSQTRFAIEAAPGGFITRGDRSHADRLALTDPAIAAWERSALDAIRSRLAMGWGATPFQIMREATTMAHHIARDYDAAGRWQVKTDDCPLEIEDAGRRAVKVNGEVHTMTPQQFQMVRKLTEAFPAAVSGTDLKDFPTSYQRPDEWLKAMPKAIGEHIKSKRGTGFWITPARSSRA